VFVPHITSIMKCGLASPAFFFNHVVPMAAFAKSWRRE